MALWELLNSFLRETLLVSHGFFVLFCFLSCGHQREDKLVAPSTGLPGFSHSIVSPGLAKNKRDNQKL